MTKAPYSYRDDPAVPRFDDSKPLFIFDNVCVLCSGGVSFIMKHDHKGLINFTSAQGELGDAIARHYAVDWDDTYLFLRNGKLTTKSDGYFEVARELGGWWKVFLLFRVVPRPLRDWVYDMVARHRYRWFGKTEIACELLTEDQKARLI
ncbi:thiol-disulfide oxidoreductase DCC family protein [Aurantiacibacter sp. D1-12]|uniref:thiol-disulfide oxidoreductase DCC family protein n=1 Tax=Aurantiacibacter sp. D1-12 TaxID=2993658 RepID=UPI00237CB208|nr:DCC1-like thiol-disulfide oxidoreductase family protein [Aurantiacibacter sp. D1-12]MDE1468300.1 DCC1-like thiol-disulfide oxidoreductase family protein [Aurantiacibacter sp. D1-12]